MGDVINMRAVFAEMQAEASLRRRVLNEVETIDTDQPPVAILLYEYNIWDRVP
jgi:hypothetical protein